MRLALIVSTAAFLIVSCKSKEHHQDQPATPAPAKTDAKAAPAKKSDGKPAATASTGGTKVECKIKSETRVLEVRGKDKGCETAYTKGGAENVVGSSQNGTSHCEGIMNKIKDKLVAAGYTCN